MLLCFLFLFVFLFWTPVPQNYFKRFAGKNVALSVIRNLETVIRSLIIFTFEGLDWWLENNFSGCKQLNSVTSIFCPSPVQISSSTEKDALTKSTLHPTTCSTLHFSKAQSCLLHVCCCLYIVVVIMQEYLTDERSFYSVSRFLNSQSECIIWYNRRSCLHPVAP